MTTMAMSTFVLLIYFDCSGCRIFVDLIFFEHSTPHRLDAFALDDFIQPVQILISETIIVIIIIMNEIHCDVQSTTSRLFV